MRIRVCDICNRQIGNKERSGWFNTYGKIKIKNEAGSYNLDICQSCLEEFQRYVLDKRMGDK